jgi:hypothetical protein
MASSKTTTATGNVKYYVLDDDTVDNYDNWRFKMMLMFKNKGWNEPFANPTVAIPTEAEANDPNATDEQKKMYKANDEAYNLLGMACEGLPLGIIQRAKGNVRDAFAHLDKKYAKKNTSYLQELLMEFNNCKLGSKKDDPDTWFIKLDTINMKLFQLDDKGTYEKKDFEMKAHILGNLPEGFEDVETKIAGQVESLSVDEIREELIQKWRRAYQKLSEKSGKTNVAMFSDGKKTGNGKPPGKFKGICRNCGKTGHKKADCKSEKVKNLCFNCGETGHSAPKCPQKKKNKQGNNNDSEGSSPSSTGMFVGATSTEWCTVGRNGKTLKSGEVMYLLDSGASTHVVADAMGLSNTSASNETVQVGNGAMLKATMTGDLTINCGDKAMSLKDVQVVPGFIKNIISLGKLSKEGNKIMFDGTTLIIENPKGDRLEVEQEANLHLCYLKASPIPRGEIFSAYTESDTNHKKSRSQWKLTTLMSYMIT